MQKRILLVEDDHVLAEVLSHNLVHEGFEVRCVADGKLALDAAKTFAPDLALLDVMLPGRSGFDLCATWRRERRFPIIIVTARDRKEDELRGFQSGADDYVTKPFNLETLLARIHAVLRRTRPSVERLELGPVTVDLVHFTARRGDAPIQLTRLEFELLRYLGERPHGVVHREELLREVWGYDDEPYTRSVDKAVARLRKKIEADPRRPEFLHTAHGDGYYLTPMGVDTTREAK
ncbi:MAG: response regulator transcription factor [Acidimicrobiia bacterium]|nr:response regulator transcription factor [Acidimicrobiia bacterium]